MRSPRLWAEMPASGASTRRASTGCGGAGGPTPQNHRKSLPCAGGQIGSRPSRLRPAMMVVRRTRRTDGSVGSAEMRSDRGLNDGNGPVPRWGAGPVPGWHPPAVQPRQDDGRSVRDDAARPAALVVSWVPALSPDGRPLFCGTARGRESADSMRGSHLTTTSAGQSAGCRRVANSEEPHGSQTPHRHQH